MDSLPHRLFALFRTALFALIFMGAVGIYLPFYLGLLKDPMHISDSRGIGILPLLLGAYIAGRCAFSFAWHGRGTPAPFDPPKHLVVTGLYRHVRNPMYTGMYFFLFGEFLIWGSSFAGCAIYMAVAICGSSAFVLLYEEPALRRKFPDEYAEYFAHVPRFLPQLLPWRPEDDKTKSAVSSGS